MNLYGRKSAEALSDPLCLLFRLPVHSFSGMIPKSAPHEPHRDDDRHDDDQNDQNDEEDVREGQPVVLVLGGSDRGDGGVSGCGDSGELENVCVIILSRSSRDGERQT